MFFNQSFDISKLNNPQIRKKWDNKKTRTRILFAFFTSFLIIIGLELASVNYSFTTIILEKAVEKSTFLKWATEVNWLKTFFYTTSPEAEALNSLSGSALKFFIFSFLTLLVSYHFISNDPLSDSELIRDLVRKSDTVKAPFLFKWMKEINFYAENTPSNQLPAVCSKCATNGCGNRLSHGEQRKTYHWNSIFAKISPSIANEILRATHSCRVSLFFKYSILIALASLVPIYFLSRAFEYFALETVYINIELITYLGTLLFLAILISQFNQVSRARPRGSWSKFSESIGNTFHLDEFQNLFIEYVCKHKQKSNTYTELNTTKNPNRFHENDTGDQLQRLITLIDYLDRVVKRKIIRTVEGNNIVGDTNSLRSILTAMLELLFVVNQKKIQFRCALFVEDSDDSCLTPLVSIPFKEKPFLTFQKKDDIKVKLALDSDCLATQSWQKRQPISASGANITYFYPEQTNHLRSMIAIPLKIDEELLQIALSLGISIDENIGVITIDCDEEGYFTSARQEQHLLEISPFVHRLIFEMLQSYFAKAGKK